MLANTLTQNDVSKYSKEVSDGLLQYANDVVAYVEGSKQFPTIPSHLLNDFYFRDAWVKKFAWAVPSKDAQIVIATGGPVLEIGAGTGFWSLLLRRIGCDVLACDANPHINDWCSFGWTDVIKGGPEMAAAHPERSLFLCWPPYNETMAYDALSAYTGNKLYYVGEGYGGCTADDAFHELLNEWSRRLVIPLPQFRGIRDHLFVFERRR